MARDTMTPDLFGASDVRGRMATEMAADRGSRAAEKGKATKAKRIADTSREAHDAVKPRTGEIYAKCLAAIPSTSPGMTADECAAEIGEDVLTVRPRFTELRDSGAIQRMVVDDRPVRRKNRSGRAAFVFVRVTQ